MLYLKMYVLRANNQKFRFSKCIYHLSGLFLSMKSASGNVGEPVFIKEGFSSSCSPLLRHTRASTVYLQNSHGCRHQGNQGLTPKEEEKVPSLLNLMTFCWWPNWHWAIQRNCKLAAGVTSNH